MGRKAQSWASFSTNLIVDGDCWRYTKTKDKDGYGISTINGVKMPAHRAAYILWYNAEAVVDKYVLHTCANRDCCNPAHLYVGDQKQNVQDQINQGTFVFGSKNGMAKLTEEIVRESRLSELSCRELADNHKVSYQTMWDALAERSWKQVK